MELFIKNLWGYDWSGGIQKSYKFTTGVYALVGQSGDDPSLVTTYMGHPCLKKLLLLQELQKDYTEFYIDGKAASLQEVRSISCLLGRWNTASKKSAHHQITKAIKNGTSKYSLEEYKEYFLLDERMYRPIRFSGNQGDHASMAIGMAQGKKVFCAPWQPHFYPHMSPMIISLYRDAIIDHGGILLLPTDNALLIKDLVDDVIDMRHPYEDRIMEDMGLGNKLNNKEIFERNKRL
ncbi:MAG: hypothetical protein FWB93_02870 [Oscillospiraceae bacterium]|nr:hypothetical protein [Oscillospiraceae bacterium]